MDKDNRIGKRREISRRGGIPPDTIILEDSRNILLTQDTLVAIANVISNVHLNRKMTSQEIRSMREYVNKMNFSSMYGLKYVEAIKEIARRFTAYRAGHQPQTVGMNRSNSLSLDDWQKNELGTLTGEEHPYKFSTFPDRVGETGHIDVQRRRIRTPGYRLGRTGEKASSGSEGIMCCLDELSDTVRSFLTADHLGRIIKQSWGTRITYGDLSIRNIYIPFDSVYRDITFNEPPALASPIPSYPARLNFKINRSTDARTEGMRIGQNAREFVEMSIGQLILPWSRDLDIFHSRITLLIEEFKEQSYFEGGDNGRRYHFEFNVTKRSHPVVGGISQIVLDPRENQSIFRFYYPVAQFETATFTFRNPYDFVRLPLDLIKFNISAASPAVFTTSTGVAHGIPDGSYVYIEGVVNGAGAEDDDFNRSSGHIINVTAASTFEVTVAGGNDIQLNLSNTQTNVSVWVGVYRFRIPISFKTLE